MIFANGWVFSNFELAITQKPEEKKKAGGAAEEERLK